MTEDAILQGLINVGIGFLWFSSGRLWEKVKNKAFINTTITSLKLNQELVEKSWKITEELVEQCIWAFDHLSKKNKETFRKQFVEKKDEIRK